MYLWIGSEVRLKQCDCVIVPLVSIIVPRESIQVLLLVITSPVQSSLWLDILFYDLTFYKWHIWQCPSNHPLLRCHTSYSSVSFVISSANLDERINKGLKDIWDMRTLERLRQPSEEGWGWACFVFSCLCDSWLSNYGAHISLTYIHLQSVHLFLFVFINRVLRRGGNLCVKAKPTRGDEPVRS